MLSPSTPLALQESYMKSHLLICLAFLGFALDCFLLRKTLVGWILFAMFVGFACLMIKYWKTYRQNYNRRMVQRDVIGTDRGN